MLQTQKIVPLRKAANAPSTSSNEVVVAVDGTATRMGRQTPQNRAGRRSWPSATPPPEGGGQRIVIPEEGLGCLRSRRQKKAANALTSCRNDASSVRDTAARRRQFHVVVPGWFWLFVVVCGCSWLFVVVVVLPVIICCCFLLLFVVCCGCCLLLLIFYFVVPFIFY